MLLAEANRSQPPKRRPSQLRRPVNNRFCNAVGLIDFGLTTFLPKQCERAPNLWEALGRHSGHLGALLGVSQMLDDPLSREVDKAFLVRPR